MPRLTIAQQIIASKLVFVNFLSGLNEDGQQAYCYLVQTVDQVEKLKGVLSRQEAFDPEHLGIVVASGLGEPTQEVRERMSREYYYNHEKEVPIQADPPPSGDTKWQSRSG